MTNPLQTIPNLPVATSIGGSEEVWINQAGVDRRTTVSAISGLTPGPPGTSTVTGPYTGQIQQTLSQAIYNGVVPISSYTSAAEQAKVLAGTSTLDYAPILTAAINTANANFIANNGSGTNTVFFDVPGLYNFQSTVDVKRCVIIRGCGGNGAGAFGYATILVWPANTTGIIINRYNTLGYNTVAGTTGADGSVIEDLAIMAQPGGNSATVYGLWMRARATCRNVTIGGFSGNNYNIVASAGSGGATEGNANGWVLDRCATYAGAPFLTVNNYTINGVNIVGADVNAGHSNLVQGASLGWGIDDSSFLGNTHTAPQMAGVGIFARVNFSGTSYQANPTTTNALLSSTTPGTNSAVWMVIASASYPTWTNGGTYYTGGAFRSPGLNARTTWINGYSESGWPGSYVGQHSLAINGLEANGWTGPGTYLSVEQGALLNNTSGIGATGTNGSETGTSIMTPFGVNISSTTNFPFAASFAVHGGNLRMNYRNLDSLVWLALTGQNTALNFGRPVPQPMVATFGQLAISDGGGSPENNNGRQLLNGTAAPTSGTWAQGDTVLNRAPAAAGVPGWMCTTGGAIATGNWAATTAYTVGALVLNDSGKTYVCVTAGTSAGSGGPTGTGSGITDGTVVWNFSVAFVFKAMANLAA